MRAEQPRVLAAGSVLRGRDLRASLRVQIRQQLGFQPLQERANAPSELVTVARIVGAGRRQPERLSSLNQGAQAHEVDSLLEALAQLRVDPRCQIARLARVAAQRGAEERVVRHDLTLAMLRS